MALKKGVCKNFDNCDLADKQEIQEVESTEFKCSECGKDLHEITKPTPAKGGSKKIVVIAAAAVVVIGAVCAYLFIGSDTEDVIPVNPDPNPGKDVVLNDSISIVVDDTTIVLSEDTLVAENSAIEEVEIEQPEQKQPEPQPQVKIQNETNLGWATYSGPMQGGKPHGVGGSLKITRNHSIDLKDGRGSKLDVQPGETIENTKFDNGQLRAGELHRKDGTRPYFNI